MSKISSQLLEALKDPKTLSLILGTAGASGLAGGYLSSQTPARRGETPGSRRLRILRNALLTAGLGGGATALGAAGVQHLENALPANDVDPVTHTLGSPVASGAAGLGTMAWLNRGSHKEMDTAATSLAKNLRGVAGQDLGENAMSAAHGGPSLDPHLTGFAENVEKATTDPTVTSGLFSGNTRQKAMDMLRARATDTNPSWIEKLLPSGLWTELKVRNALANAGAPVTESTAANLGIKGLHSLFGVNSTLANAGRRGIAGSPLARTGTAAMAALLPALLTGSQPNQFVNQPQ